jgi:hypothetical protein
MRLISFGPRRRYNRRVFAAAGRPERSSSIRRQYVAYIDSQCRSQFVDFVQGDSSHP